MHITTISLNLPLKESQIPLFKQAILSIEGISQEWYNNKKITKIGKETNLHRYPPIQYRVLDGYATIWAINSGAKKLEADLKKKKFLAFFWEGRQRTFQLIRHFTNASEEAAYTSTKKMLRYRLINYLPFSNHKAEGKKESTWQEYSNAATMYDKIAILERLIVSHLVLFSYAADWQLQPKQKLKATIADIKNISWGYYKKSDKEKEKCFRKFDLEIELNALLPDGIALGNLTSLGYGVLYRPAEEAES